MKKILSLTLCFLVFNSFSPDLWAGWDPAKDKKRIKNAQETIKLFLKKDPSLKRFFENAYAYVVFPAVGKGGFFIGGAHGKGIVYRQGKVVARSGLTQISLGLQAGGQAYREIIFFKDKAAFTKFADGKLEFGAKVSAVAVNKGVATTAEFNNGVAVFTIAKGGLMLEASVAGQKFSYKPIKKK